MYGCAYANMETSGECRSRCDCKQRNVWQNKFFSHCELTADLFNIIVRFDYNTTLVTVQLFLLI